MAREDGETGVEATGGPGVELAWRRTARWAFSELLSTALLVMLGCMTLLPDADGRPQPLEHAALAFGFVVLANVQAFGGVSGAHMNPAVTLAAVLTGECEVKRGVLYAISQCVGSTLGFGLLLAVSPASVSSLQSGCTVPSRVSPLQALVVEVVLTFVLGLLCCALWRPVVPAPAHDPTVPIKFGLTVAGLVYAGGLMSGASLNPARSLGPALWHNQWTAHWVYWCGPLGGAALAAVLYRWVLTPPRLKASVQLEPPQELLLPKRDA